MIVAENRWLAARHGLRTPLVHRGEEPVTARTLVHELLGRVADDATALQPTGRWRRWPTWSIAAASAGASSSYRRSDDLTCVLSELADETDPF